MDVFFTSSIIQSRKQIIIGGIVSYWPCDGNTTSLIDT